MFSGAQVRCLFFASLRDAVGANEVSKDVADGVSVAQLIQGLELDYPKLEAHRGRYQVAVQQELVELDYSLQDGDEVAFIPPVSGGSDSPDSIRLVEEPIAVSQVLAVVQRNDCGAINLFLGTVRDFAHSPGYPSVEHIDYSAYIPMALKQMHILVGEARQRWELGAVALWHRLGIVPAGDASLALAVSSRHRHESLAATAWLIDELKQRVPIWKKEVGPEGQVWLEGEARHTALQELPSASDNTIRAGQTH